jgi:hypothetical protein
MLKNRLAVWGMNSWQAFIKYHQKADVAERNSEHFTLSTKTKTKLRYLAAWKTFAYSKNKRRGLLNTILKNMKTKSTAKGMLGWHAFMDLYRQKQEEQVKLVRFARKLHNREALATFAAWVDFLDWRGHARGLIRHILARLDNSFMAKGMLGWHQFMCNLGEYALRREHFQEALREQYRRRRERKRNAELLISRIRERCVRAVVNMWARVLQQSNRNRNAITRILANFRFFLITKGMLGWHAYMDLYRQKQEEQVKLARFARKLQSHCTFRAFDVWLLFVWRRLRARALSMRILKRGDVKLVFEAMIAWKDLSERLRRGNAERRKLVRFARKIKFQETRISLQGWIDFVDWRQKARVLIYKIFNKLKNMELHAGMTSLRACYEEWKHEKKGQIKLARFLSKIQNRESSLSLDSWIEFVDLRKRARVLIFKVFHKLENLELHKGIMTWREFLAKLIASKKEKEQKAVRVQRLLAKIRHHTVNASYITWLSFVQWRKHSRSLLVKIFSQLDHYATFKGMLHWKFFVAKVGRFIEDREVMLTHRSVARSRMLKKIQENDQALIRAVWGALRQIINEAHAVKQKLERLASKLSGNSQKACWGKWRCYRAILNARKRALRHSAVGIYRRVISKSFSTWKMCRLSAEFARLKEEAEEKTSILQQQTAVIVELSNFIFSHLGLPAVASESGDGIPTGYVSDVAKAWRK